MPRRSAGLMMFRRRDKRLEVFLVHPGGPFWTKKNLGAWGIPKGEHDPGEEPMATAVREFGEETGFAVTGDLVALGAITQKGGKIVTAWAFEGDGNPAALKSNTCEIEWPPRSGRIMEIPEIDEGRWFTISSAREHMRADQQPLLDALIASLNIR